MERKPNTIYTLSLSYGKDSIASIEACKQLGYPIDRIVHAEIWATDDISADLPPMVEFKSKADAIIKERYGIEVEHVCATAKDGSKQTYEKLFYHVPKRRAEREREREREREQSSASHKSRGIGVPRISSEQPYGFPVSVGRGNWCTQLKQIPIRGTTNRISVSHKMVYKRTQDDAPVQDARNGLRISPNSIRSVVSETQTQSARQTLFR